MVEYKDSVKDQTTTTGTGTVTVGGVAPAGYLTIASAHTDGATIHYRISLPDQSQWEVGEGVWTATGATLTRVTVFASSNSGALVSFSAGTKSILTTIVAIDLQKGTFSGWSFRNRFINPRFKIDQRNSGAAQTITAGAALAYTVDRWFAWCTGANVTGQQVASGSSATLKKYQFTGAASVTGINFAQRIKSDYCYDLAGKTCTLSINLANSLLTTVNWTAYYANTTDTFGSIASPTKTQIATGSFTVSSTVTRYSVQLAVPTNATNGVEIVFNVGAQTSGTWTIEDAQIEPDVVPSPIEDRLGLELLLCSMYRYQSNPNPASGTQVGMWAFKAVSSNVAWGGGNFPIPMWATPTITLYNSTGGVNGATIAETGSSPATTNTANNPTNYGVQEIVSTGSTPWTANQAIICQVVAEAEL